LLFHAVLDDPPYGYSGILMRSYSKQHGIARRNKDCTDDDKQMGGMNGFEHGEEDDLVLLVQIHPSTRYHG
jgi:hypothetical protein